VEVETLNYQEKKKRPLRRITRNKEMAATNILTCTNKGCYSQDYHKLDVESNDVVCVDCGQTVDINPYMKKIMKDSGQVFKRAKSTKEVTCKQCKVADVPVLLDYGVDTFEVVCNHCGTMNQHLTNFFIEPLKMNPQVERHEVTVAENPETGEDTVVLASGQPLPWNDPNRSEAPTPEQRKSDEKVREEALRKAASQARRRRYEEQQAAAIAAVAPPPAQPKVRGAAKRVAPANAQDMLSRAGLNYTGDLEADDEPPARRIIKQPKARKGGPSTAAEMLEQAGFGLAVLEEEDYA
jgi:hypothetical protein